MKNFIITILFIFMAILPMFGYSKNTGAKNDNYYVYDINDEKVFVSFKKLKRAYHRAIGMEGSINPASISIHQKIINSIHRHDWPKVKELKKAFRRINGETIFYSWTNVLDAYERGNRDIASRYLLKVFKLDPDYILGHRLAVKLSLFDKEKDSQSIINSARIAAKSQQETLDWLACVENKIWNDIKDESFFVMSDNKINKNCPFIEQI